MIRILSKSTGTAVLLSRYVVTEGQRATSAKLAACVEMEKGMGLGETHDHAEMKGMGRNPMNISHQRCVQILSQPA